jgi:hypothetical protein
MATNFRKAIACPTTDYPRNSETLPPCFLSHITPAVPTTDDYVLEQNQKLNIADFWFQVNSTTQFWVLFLQLNFWRW